MRPPRIAVTGIGIVSSLGSDAPSTFSALFAGERGILPVTLFDVDGQRSKLAAEVRGLTVADVAPRGQAEEWSRSDALAVLAAREALTMASAPPAEPLGLAVGATSGGMYEAESVLAAMHAGGEQDAVRRLLSYPLSTSAERVAQVIGGVRHRATVCSACSSGANALVLGAAWLRTGRCRRVLAGGTDGLCRLTFAGFNALGATDPEPCRPFDVHRAGLSLGEGAAFLVLESEADAVRRDATVLAWFDGWAVGAEAHHVTHPEANGDTATRLIGEALGRAGITPADLDYVNAHGTATPQNDAAEALALGRALGDEVRRVWVSSSKGQVGHTLGAAGAIEAAFSVFALSRGELPPTAGLDHPDPAAPLRHVRHRGKPASLRTALSTSFGFGGTDSVLVFTAPRFPQHQPEALLPRRVLVTAAASLGPLGRLADAENRALVADSGALSVEPDDPLALLDAGRSRRFDQASALAAVGAETMLSRRGRDAAGVGLAVGSAFGNVDRSVHFLQRLFERGPRFVSPAEFPHLVPSAPSGNASIYVGLTGPVVGVSELEASAESSLAVALSFLELGIANAMIAGCAEPRDPVVDRVLAPLHVEAAQGASGRPGGAAWLLLDTDAADDALAELVLVSEAPSGSRLELTEPAPGAVVLSGLVPGVLRDVLAGTAWAEVPKMGLHAALGRAEARGGFALAAAAAWVARGDAPEVLAVGAARGWVYATLLRKCS